MDGLIDCLNTQGKQLNDWREKAIRILLMPLVDEDDEETTGEEYEISTKAQDELQVCDCAIQGLRANLVSPGQCSSLGIYALHRFVAQVKADENYRSTSPYFAPSLPTDIDSLRGSSINSLKMKQTWRRSKPKTEEVQRQSYF